MDVNGVNIDFLGHSGFLISYKIHGRSQKIAIDPYNISNHLDKVDIILVTHNHYDHCSIKDISKLSREGSVVIAPVDSQSKISKINGVGMQVIEIGDEISFNGIRVEALPAYNIDKKFHPKREGWLGYLIKINNIIIYHSGDSDNIPEIKHLTGYGKHGNTFIVMLPVSGKSVMTSDEAAEVAGLLKADLAFPMHYGSDVIGTKEDAQRFVKLCHEKGINAQILDKI